MHDYLRSILGNQNDGLHGGNHLVAVELRAAIVALRRRALNFDQEAGVQHGLSALIGRVELQRATDYRDIRVGCAVRRDRTDDAQLQRKARANAYRWEPAGRALAELIRRIAA